MPKLNDKAPDFKLPDQGGLVHSNKDYLGKWLLIYFYPKDFTSGCTTEACNLRDNFGKLKSKVEIVGVSKDSTESHTKFKDKYKLPFTLLSDEKGEMIKSYETNGMIFPRRTSFLINPKGKIEKIYKNVKPQSHAEEIIKDLLSY